MSDQTPRTRIDLLLNVSWFKRSPRPPLKLPTELLCPQRGRAAKNFPATAPAIFQRSSNLIGSLADRNWPEQRLRKLGPERQIAEMYRGRISLSATFGRRRNA